VTHRGPFQPRPCWDSVNCISGLTDGTGSFRAYTAAAPVSTSGSSH